VLDAGDFFNEKFPAEKRRWSLRDLVARVLRRHVPKELEVTCSNWESALSREQVTYAANDANAPILVYMAIVGEKVPPLCTSEHAGRVEVVSDTQQELASAQLLDQLDDDNVPLPEDFLQELHEASGVPVEMMRPTANTSSPASQQQPPAPVSSSDPGVQPMSGVTLASAASTASEHQQPLVRSSLSGVTLASAASAASEHQQPPVRSSLSGVTLASAASEHQQPPVPSSYPGVQPMSGVNLASASFSQQQPAPSSDAGAQPLSAPTSLPDRSIKEDVVHIMFRYKKDGLASTSGDHKCFIRHFIFAYAAPFFWITCKCFVVCPADPLCITFMKSLSLAFFVTDPEDVATMKTWLKNVRGMTDEAIQNLPMSYFHKRCRRYIPPPLQLARRLRCEL
jgi:hypothetical protein